MPRKMLQMTVYLDEQLLDELKESADSLDVTLQEYTRASLRLGSGLLRNVLSRRLKSGKLAGRVDAVIQLLGAQAGLMVVSALAPVLKTTKADAFGDEIVRVFEEALSGT